MARRANASVLPVLTDAALDVGWSLGSTTAVSRFLSHVQRGEPVAVRVFGGSQTAGFGCTEGSRTLAACSWSSRVVDWMRTSFPLADVRYFNLARGGITTPNILSTLPLLLRQTSREDGQQGIAPSGALYLVDTLINDAHEFNAKHVGSTTSNAPKGWQQGADAAKGASISMERLVQVFRAMVPDAALVGLLSACDSCMALHLAHLQVFEFYQVPVIDFPRMAPSIYPDLPWPCCHLSYKWHQVIAEAVIWGMQRVGGACHGRDCRPPEIPAPHVRASQRASSYWPSEALASFPVCFDGLTDISAFDAIGTSGSRRGQQNGGAAAVAPISAPTMPTRQQYCTLMEDRPSKPGWILQRPATSSAAKSAAAPFVEFEVAFGAQPTLIVSYLVSYPGTGFGDAWLTVNNVSHRLRGTRTDVRVSQTHSDFWAAYHRP